MSELTSVLLRRPGHASKTAFLQNDTPAPGITSKSSSRPGAGVSCVYRGFPLRSPCRFFNHIPSSHASCCTVALETRDASAASQAHSQAERQQAPKKGTGCTCALSACAWWSLYEDGSIRSRGPLASWQLGFQPQQPASGVKISKTIPPA